jgi:cell division protein FtsI/penicillin-binding protein 2
MATRDPLQADDAPTSEFERTWKVGVKHRVVLIVAALGLWVSVIEARLVHLQVLLHDEYTTRARNQQKAAIPLEAVRGDITDRHGRLLAFSVEADAITADPSLITDPSGTVRALCRALADCTPQERTTLMERLSADRRFASVRRPRDVTPEQVERVRALGLTGVLITTDTRRYHPLLHTAAHVIGTVGADNQGLAGIEYSFNKDIRGVDGRAIADVDRNRQRQRTRVERPPVPGASLVLTIDATLQHVAERELEAGIKAHDAVGGTVIIMEPHSGEVLALANYPTFNPNVPNLSPQHSQKNRAIQDAYEPGSTFKLVTAAAALGRAYYDRAI